MQTPSTNTSKVCSNPELLDSADQNHVAQKKHPGGWKQAVRPWRRFLGVVSVVGCRGDALDDNPPAADAPGRGMRSGRVGGRSAG